MISMPVTTLENQIRGVKVWGLPKVVQGIDHFTEGNNYVTSVLDEIGQPYWKREFLWWATLKTCAGSRFRHSHFKFASETMYPARLSIRPSVDNALLARGRRFLDSDAFLYYLKCFFTRGEIVSLLRKPFSLMRRVATEAALYAKHKIKGTSYTTYYAERMNLEVKRNPKWGAHAMKKFHLEYLKNHGLTPDHKFFDYGCGAVNSGLFFIEFLNPGKYFGADIAENVLAEGRARIEKANLSAKNPTLVHIPDGNLGSMPNEQFDFIWAQSVLTHMRPEDIESLFRNIQKFLKPSTCFYATFANDERGPTQRRFKDWYYDREFFLKTAAAAGLKCEFMPDWKNPQDSAGVDMLACLTLLRNS